MKPVRAIGKNATDPPRRFHAMPLVQEWVSRS